MAKDTRSKLCDIRTEQDQRTETEETQETNWHRVGGKTLASVHRNEMQVYTEKGRKETKTGSGK